MKITPLLYKYEIQKEVPKQLVRDFSIDTGVSRTIEEKVRNGDLTIVAVEEKHWHANGITVEETQPIGFISCEKYYDKLLSVNGFYVVDEHRHQGVGIHLMGRLLMYAKRQGFEEIYATTMLPSTCKLFMQLKDRFNHTKWLKFETKYWYDNYGSERVMGSVRIIHQDLK